MKKKRYSGYYVLPDSPYLEELRVDESNKPVVALVINSMLSCLADNPCLNNAHPRKYYDKLISLFRTNGYVHTINLFSEIADKIRRQAADRQDEMAPIALICEIKQTPLFGTYLHWVRTDDTGVFAYLITFFELGKQAEFVNPDLQTSALGVWRSDEQRLSATDYSVESNPFLETIRSVIHALLPIPQDLTETVPTYGGGAVAEKYSRAGDKKLTRSTYNRALDEAFFSHTGLARRWFVPNLRLWLLSRHVDVLSQTHKGKRVVKRPRCLIVRIGDKRRYKRKKPIKGTKKRAETRRLKAAEDARWETVPKNSKTVRPMCCEPARMSYFQQVVRHWLERAIKLGEFGRFININDQSLSQQAAYEGSVFRRRDTTDLSRASDALAMDVVEYTFPEWWVNKFTATRSSTVLLPDGTIHPLKKFAPMGSALCFPVQSIFYCAVAIASSLIHKRQMAGGYTNLYTFTPDQVKKHILIDYGWTSSDRVYTPPQVYGDDIVTDEKITSVMVTMLKALGFVMNLDKSFTGSSPFREACGKHYLYGDDVTPFRLKVKGVKQRLTPQAAESIIDLANRLYVHNNSNDGMMYGSKPVFKRLRSFLVHYVLTTELEVEKRKDHKERTIDPDKKPWKKNPFLMVSGESKFKSSMAIITNCPTNDHLLKPWDKDWQSDTLIHLSPVLLGNRLVVDDEDYDGYLYRRWLSACAKRTNTTDDDLDTIIYGGGVVDASIVRNVASRLGKGDSAVINDWNHDSSGSAKSLRRVNDAPDLGYTWNWTPKYRVSI